MRRTFLFLSALLTVAGGLSTVVAQDDPDDGASVSLEAASGVQPAAIRIAKIDVESEIETVGIVEGFLQQPTSPNGVGWYGETSGLGVSGNVVLTGAFRGASAGVDDATRLGELQAGDLIEISDTDESRYTYAVETLTEYAGDELPVDEIIAQTPDEQLTLVGIAGSQDADESVTVLRAVRTADASSQAPTATSIADEDEEPPAPADAATAAPATTPEADDPTAEPATTPEADDAGPAASGELLDLAAMAVLPEDVEPDGFGLSAGRFATAAEIAASFAENGLGETDDLLGQIDAAGFRQHYSVSLSLARDEESADDGPAAVLTATVTELDSEEGAASFYALLSDRTTDALATPAAASTTIGAQSTLVRRSGTTADQRALPFQQADLVFREGNLVARVVLTDLTNAEITSDAVEAIATNFQNRIDEVREDGGPRLSEQLIRLDGEGVVSRQDFYTRRDGTSFSLYRDAARETFGVGESEAEGRDTRLADVEDAYIVAEAVAAGRERSSDDVRIVVTLYRFTDEAAASAWFEDVNDIARRNRDLLDEPETIGDQSMSVASGGSGAARRTGRGYQVTTRVGDQVALVRVLALPEAPLAVVRELAELQAACMEAGSCGERVALPVSLAELAVLDDPESAAEDGTAVTEESADEATPEAETATP